jgi:TatA/E family protein of Tat protein translocase
MLGNIGPLEIGVVLIVALLVFGPKRLPELGNSLGRGIKEFRDTVSGLKHDDDAKPLTAPPVAPAAEKSAEAGVSQAKRS